MNFRERITTPRIIAFALLASLLLVGVALATSTLLSAYKANVAVILAFIVLPLIFLVPLFLIVFTKGRYKWWAKGLLIYGVLQCFMIAFVVLLVFGQVEYLDHYQNQDVAKHYTTKIAECYEYEHMPSLAQVGEPENIDLYVYSCETIFYSEAHVLICQYDEAQYQSQKADVEQRYVFQQEVISHYEEKCEPTAHIDGYTFRMVSVDGKYEEELRYPNRMILIATNDETRELVYIAFYDSDLDVIHSLSDFIIDYCGWDYIR